MAKTHTCHPPPAKFHLNTILWCMEAVCDSTYKLHNCICAFGFGNVPEGRPSSWVQSYKCWRLYKLVKNGHINSLTELEINAFLTFSVLLFAFWWFRQFFTLWPLMVTTMTASCVWKMQLNGKRHRRKKWAMKEKTNR